MKITVVVPTCHRNFDLAKCLDCLAPGVQTLDPAEYDVIVSDDGVATTAEQMMRSDYPWAMWTRGPRRGPAANRNHGAGLATTDWLAFTDDDCLPSEGWLQAYFDARGQAEVLEGLTCADREMRRHDEESPINLYGGYLWSCNFAIRKTLFEELGEFDENYPAPALEDCDLRERIIAHGTKFKFIPQAKIVHPWRERKNWRFWLDWDLAFRIYVQKHRHLKPTNIRLYYLEVAVRQLHRLFKEAAAMRTMSGIWGAVRYISVLVYLAIRINYVKSVVQK